MAIHKVVTSKVLRDFVTKGKSKIFLVKDNQSGKYDNLGAVSDLEFEGKNLSWKCSSMRNVQADRVKEIRHRSGDDYNFFEVELPNYPNMTLIFRNAQSPEELEAIKGWNDERLDKKGIRADLRQALIDLKGLGEPIEVKKRKFFFSFWAQYVHGAGLYPVGFVIATGSYLKFYGLDGYEILASSWQEDFGNDVTGNPQEDLKQLSKRGVMTSFSIPEPIFAGDILDAARQCFEKANSSKRRIDKALNKLRVAV